MTETYVFELTKEECDCLVKAIESTHLPIKSKLWPLHNKIKYWVK